MIETLIEKLNSLSPISESIVTTLGRIARTATYKAGEYLLKEGQVCTRACLIVKGLTRSFYINKGIEITSRFMTEGDIVTSWMSYYTQSQSIENIQAYEDTDVAYLNYEDVKKLLLDYPEFNKNVRCQVEYAFFRAEQRTQMLRYHNAEEKYKLFLEYHPTLLNRVSQKHIATYLWITEETLSRIRKKILRNSK
jgi:CRP-like cAMP-binding protein